MLFVLKILQELLQVVDHVVVAFITSSIIFGAVMLCPYELGYILNDFIFRHFSLGIGAVLFNLAALHSTSRADDGVVLSATTVLLDVGFLHFDRFSSFRNWSKL